MIFLGKIVKTRGNKGEVAVTLSPDVEELLYTFSKGEVVVLKSTKYQRECSAEYFKEISRGWVVKFKDVNTINEALKLVGYSIYRIQTGERTGQNTGTTDFVVEDTGGHPWGKVKDMDAAGLNRILEVEDSGGDIIYVPFADGIVKQIDEENKVIIIDPPNGLKGLNK